MRQTIPCSVPGCKGTRTVTKNAWAIKYCADCYRKISLDRSFWKQHLSVIQEVKVMAAQGYDAKDIAAALGRQRAFIQRCIDIPPQKENRPYKVISADYWPVGIEIDASKLENEILKNGNFDPSAVLKRGEKKYRVVRRRARQELRAIC